MRYALALTSALLCLCFIPKKDKHRETFIYDHEQALDPAEEMRLDTLFRSTTTDASSQRAPALIKSSLMPGEPVTRRPR